MECWASGSEKNATSERNEEYFAEYILCYNHDHDINTHKSSTTNLFLFTIKFWLYLNEKEMRDEILEDEQDY